MPRSAHTRCASCSTRCAGSCARAALGACCPTICRRGRRSSSRPSDGCARVAWKPWRTICACRHAPAPRTGRRTHGSAIMDGRTLQSSPESGARAGYDGYKRKKGSKVHVAVDTLGHPACSDGDAGQRTGTRAGRMHSPRRCRRPPVKAWSWLTSDQGYTGEESRRLRLPPRTASSWQVVKLAAAKRGFVLLPRRWVVERSFAWLARFRRLSRDYERLPTTLAGLHWLAFACLLLGNLFKISLQG